MPRVLKIPTQPRVLKIPNEQKSDFNLNKKENNKKSEFHLLYFILHNKIQRGILTSVLKELIYTLFILFKKCSRKNLHLFLLLNTLHDSFIYYPNFNTRGEVSSFSSP